MRKLGLFKPVNTFSKIEHRFGFWPLFDGGGGFFFKKYTTYFVIFRRYNHLLDCSKLKLVTSNEHVPWSFAQIIKYLDKVCFADGASRLRVHRKETRTLLQRSRE